MSKAWIPRLLRNLHVGLIRHPSDEKNPSERAKVTSYIKLFRFIALFPFTHKLFNNQ